jgi:hypothetical protein
VEDALDQLNDALQTRKKRELMAVDGAATGGG